MLSQTLPNESVAPQSYMPSRVKSAYVKLVGEANGFQDGSTASFLNRYEHPTDQSNNFEDRPFTASKRLSASFRRSEDHTDEMVYRSRNFQSQSPQRGEDHSRLPSAHDIVNARNANERIKELEKTNLNLKRMLEFVQDPVTGTERVKSSGPKLLVHRSVTENPLGPPVLRQGRIGSSWRHIKQTNNYGNSNLLFIDGTVRINDSARFPPQIYGYPPKVTDHSEELIGLNSQSLNDINLPLQQRVRNRPANLNSYANPFHDRAKQGFEYWNKDKRNPENNKTKAANISIGYPFFKPGF